MNCIIGADKIGCKLLEEFIQKSDSINLAGTFNDSVSLKNQLSKQLDIDLVFLDIEMLKIDDFDFVNSLARKPNIIVISSRNQNALKVFDLNIIDYLLKPVTYLSFCTAVYKAKRYHSRKDVSTSGDDEIFIKKGLSLVKLKIKDIIYIEERENNVTLNTNNERFPIHFTLKAIENQLSSEFFIRIHQSFIVNKSMIQSINENSLDLIVGHTLKSIPVENSYRNLLLDDINIMAK
jgi:DNA-binding LytR/AlgR family response regulator